MQQGIKDVEALPSARDVVFGGRRWYFLKKHARCINVQLYILQECGVNNIHHYHCCGKKNTLFFKFVKTMKNSRQFVGAAMNRQIKLNQVRTSILCNDLIVHANAYKGSSNKGFAKE